jgi:hypothetical protein
MLWGERFIYEPEVIRTLQSRDEPFAYGGCLEQATNEDDIMQKKSFIKINRHFIDKKNFRKANDGVLYTALVCMAAYKKQKVLIDRGMGRSIAVEAQRGEVVGSIPTLASELGITIKSFRGLISRLHSDGHIRVCPETITHTKITILDYIFVIMSSECDGISPPMDRFLPKRAGQECQKGQGRNAKKGRAGMPKRAGQECDEKVVQMVNFDKKNAKKTSHKHMILDDKNYIKGSVHEEEKKQEGQGRDVPVCGSESGIQSVNLSLRAGQKPSIRNKLTQKKDILCSLRSQSVYVLDISVSLVVRSVECACVFFFENPMAKKNNFPVDRSAKGAVLIANQDNSNQDDVNMNPRNELAANGEPYAFAGEMLKITTQTFSDLEKKYPRLDLEDSLWWIEFELLGKRHIGQKLKPHQCYAAMYQMLHNQHLGRESRGETRQRVLIDDAKGPKHIQAYDGTWYPNGRYLFESPAMCDSALFHEPIPRSYGYIDPEFYNKPMIFKMADGVLVGFMRFDFFKSSAPISMKSWEISSFWKNGFDICHILDYETWACARNRLGLGVGTSEAQAKLIEFQMHSRPFDEWLQMEHEIRNQMNEYGSCPSLRHKYNFNQLVPYQGKHDWKKDGGVS